MKIAFVFLITTLLMVVSCKQQLESRLATDLIETQELTGDYMGQPTPGSIPELFAPNIISNGLINRDITFTPEGDEIYTTFSTSDYSYAAVLSSKKVNGIWSNPEVVSFATSPEYVTIEPCISHDGSRLFFATNRPVNDSTKNDDTNIWVVKREGSDWGTPQVLDTIINTNLGEFYPSITKSGCLYFTRDEKSGVSSIYKSAYVNGKFTKPERLPDQVNCGRNRFNAYVSPDENYIIIPALGVEKDVTGVNYYITFKQDNGLWSEPINMGQVINKDLGRGWSASLSPDGKYLFFMSSCGFDEKSQPWSLTYNLFQQLQSEPKNGNADIYWVKSDFIEDLKAKAVLANAK
jgi:Tol biopolymer transport system component